MTGNSSIDALETELIACERSIARMRARQADLLRDLAAAGVHGMDGSRSMVDWTAARLDVTRETARHLDAAARLFERSPALATAAAEGEVSFDRAVATARLAATGADEATVASSAGLDLAGVRRLAARHGRRTRKDEETAHRERFLAIQPSLGESSWRVWGEIPGLDGRAVDKALHQIADELPRYGQTVGARLADALVKMAQDSLDGGTAEGGAVAPLATVFVDAALASPTGGEAGAELAAGPPVGPATLEAILCGGRVQVVVTDGDRPVVASPAKRAIPPAMRRFVLHRDGGCVVSGCASRYRLQPHHITPFSAGGSHDAENLATLCWYHHHVAIHGDGFRLDPESPPRRRRLLRPQPARGPPAG